MKIRIFDDTIRLRLDRSEVDLIGQGESVTGVTHFRNGATFCYQLSVQNIGLATAGIEGTTIQVALPETSATRWANSEREVSIRATDGELELLIEKDFECLDPREGENQSNRFKNPKAS